MVLSRRTAVAGLLAVPVALIGVSPPSMADPEGTVAVSSGSSAYSLPIWVDGATPEAMLLTVGNSQRLILKGGKQIPLPPPSLDGEQWSIHGDLLMNLSYDPATDSAIFRYRSLDGSYQGMRSETDPSATTYIWTNVDFGLTSRGWVRADVSLSPDAAFTSVDAVTGDRVALGSPKPCGDVEAAAVDGDGIAVVCRNEGEAVEHIYHRGLGSSDVWTPVGNLSGHRDWGESLSYGSSDFLSGESELHLAGGSVFVVSVSGVTRFPLLGGTAKTYPAPPARYPGGALRLMSDLFAVTATHMGFAVLKESSEGVAGPENMAYISVPLAGGSWTLSPSRILQGFASNGTKFLFGSGGDSPGSVLLLASHGVYSAASATSTPVLEWRDAQRLRASALSLGADRVAWLDDSSQASPVFSRTYSRSADVLSMGPRASYGKARTGGVAVSGRRTVSFTGEPAVCDPAGCQESEVKMWISGRGLSQRHWPAAGTTAVISGTRVLRSIEVREGWASTIGVLDLVTGTTSLLDWEGASLWGDTLVGQRAGAVIVRNLVTKSEKVVAAAPPVHWYTVSMAVQGDYVAWVRVYAPHYGAPRTTVSYRNFRTMGPTTTIRTPAYALALTGSYVVFSTPSFTTNDPAGLAYVRLGTSDVQPIDAKVQDTVSAVGSVVAWTDAATGSPKMAPLPAQSDPPRYLGNPIAPATAMQGARWSAEWVMSKPLPTCAVRITTEAGAPVRTLNCATTDGSAVVSWDTKDSAGKQVPLGTYRWTVTGKDADGSLRNTDGSAKPITGTVRVVVPRVSIAVARAGYGNELLVDVNPNLGSKAWTFRVQKRSTTGWTTLPTVYTTVGDYETRRIMLGAGEFRVVVAAGFGYAGNTSASVVLTKPIVRVKAVSDEASDKILVNVDPNKGSGYWTFQVQRNDGEGWVTLATVYQTLGTEETRQVNLGDGIYRVRVHAKYGFLGAYSGAVYLFQ